MQLCKEKKWSTSDTIFELREFNGSSFKIKGKIIPLIPLFCENCGNTILINAIKAEIINPSLSIESEET